MNDKLFGALSLCKKAGALTLGFDSVCEAMAKGEVKLLLFAQDLSPATKKRVLHRNTQGLPYADLLHTQSALAMLARKPVGVLAITDENLAALCQRALPNKEETV